jgi:hypothetical protein
MGILYLSDPAKRRAMLRVRPVHYWPPRAVIPADRTSRSGASSVWWGLGNRREMGHGERTSVAHATTLENNHCGIRGIKMCSIHQQNK